MRATPRWYCLINGATVSVHTSSLVLQANKFVFNKWLHNVHCDSIHRGDTSKKCYCPAKYRNGCKVAKAITESHKDDTIWAFCFLVCITHRQMAYQNTSSRWRHIFVYKSILKRETLLTALVKSMKNTDEKQNCAMSFFCLLICLFYYSICALTLIFKRYAQTSIILDIAEHFKQIMEMRKDRTICAPRASKSDSGWEEFPIGKEPERM